MEKVFAMERRIRRSVKKPSKNVGGDFMLLSYPCDTTNQKGQSIARGVNFFRP